MRSAPAIPENQHERPYAHRPAARDLANENMKRLDALALTLTNARGFRVWIEELHSRDLSVVKPPHVDAIHMTRAGMLRAAITSIMAALDTKSRDRASVGQIIHMLEVLDLSTLAYRWPHAGFGAATLQQAKADWQAILQRVDSSQVPEGLSWVPSLGGGPGILLGRLSLC